MNMLRNTFTTRCLSTFPILNLTRRTDMGSRAVTQLRARGHLPGSVYGPGPSCPEGTSVPVSIETKTFQRLFRVHGETLENTVFQGQVEDDPVDSDCLLIPRQMRFDPATDVPLAVNFVRFRPGRHVDIPVEYINADASPGLKRGGYVNTIHRTIKCACDDPADIPPTLVVDLTGARVGTRLRIRDCALPASVKALVEDDKVIVATIAGKRGIKTDEDEEK